jgi:cardiolipin synthase
MRERLPALRPGHHVQLLEGWRELYAAMAQAIDHGRLEVRLETYIFEMDSAGEELAATLERAALRGLKVYVVADGAGTEALPEAWAQRFARAGVQWLLFRPLGRLGVLIPSRWRRLHRKLCVVDGRVAFCGGINVLHDCNDPNHGHLPAPRLDFAVRVTGPLVRQVHETMVQFWARAQVGARLRHAELGAAWQELQQALLTGAAAAAPPEPVRGMGVRAALLLRDNLRHRSQIERAYRKAIAEAREEIIIANAYFAPGRKLRQALFHARRRGVRVRLLLQGRYEYFMQFHAVRMMYDMLLAAGLEIYEYTPSFLHAKVAVIDGHWATVGSSNLDPLSLLLAREANVVVQDRAFAAQLRQRLLHAIEREARAVDATAYANRPWQQRLLDRVAFMLMRAGVFLTGNRY